MPSKVFFTRTVNKCDEKLNCFQFNLFDDQPVYEEVEVRGLNVPYQYDNSVPRRHVNMSPEVAQKLRVKSGDTIEITVTGKILRGGNVNKIWKHNILYSCELRSGRFLKRCDSSFNTFI